MLELVYLTVLAIAFYAAKLAVIDRVAEVLSATIGMILFAMLTFASFSVRPAFAPDEPVAMEPMAWLAAGSSLFCLVIVLLAATQRLPTTTNTENHV